MTQHNSKRREDWQRITLRLPPDLYHHLVESAHDHRQSLNSRIMDLLHSERPTADHAEISQSLFASWTKAFREIEHRVVELELAREAWRKPRFTFGVGVEEGFRALDVIAARSKSA
jgi:hypothetical protein